MQSNIETAFDVALAYAKIDEGSVRWLNNRTLGCTINGESYSAVVTVRSVDGLREALARCLNTYCALHAVANVVGGR